MTLYISPYTLGSNRALTYGDKDGINWILEYRNTNIPIVKEEETNVKYAQYYFETMKNTKNFQYLIEYNQIIPSHFGYDTNRTIGDSFAYLPDADVYMITTEMMRLTPYAVPIDRRSQIKSFNDKDFIYLNNDPTVNLIYLSNKFEVWNIAIPKNVENY